jgi:hypothetical protein
MSDIKDRIKKLGAYFNEMKVGTGQNGEEYIYVTTIFPREWVLDGRTMEKFNVSCSQENGLTYFWADLNTEFSTLFDAIDFNVKVNLDAQEKVILFNSKIDELKTIFADENNDIDKLKSLKFVFDDVKPSSLPFTVTQDTKKKKVKTTENE